MVVNVFSREVEVTFVTIWKFHISSTDAAYVISNHLLLSITTLGGERFPSLNASPFSEIYVGATADPFGVFPSGLWSVVDNGSDDWSIDFILPSDTTNFTDINDWTDFNLDIVVPDLELNPITIHNFSIEIVNTISNTMVLVEEFTEENAPTLQYDGGDDIYAPMLNSKLIFNLLVDDASDGKYDHLYTGNENQFLVKLFNVNVDLTKDLLWQGFLLPEVYTEPYKNGVFFVEFTAIDMLSTLNKKTLKPWYYNNRIPAGMLLSFLLKETGLNQKIIVAPSLVPENVSINWSDINVPLSHYFKDNKYADCQKILEDFLIANGLSLYNYRGYWFVIGATRKIEAIKSGCFLFGTNGYLESLITINEREVEPMMAPTPVIKLLAPFKKVNIDLSIDTKKKLFTDEVAVTTPGTTYWLTDYTTFGIVVLLKNFLYTPISGLVGSPSVVYWISQIKPWLKVGTALDFQAQILNDNWFVLQTRVAYSGAFVTEATALNNYFECVEFPSVEAGVSYKFKYKINKVRVNNGFDVNALNNGVYDKLAPFQLFIGGQEYMAMRPGFSKNLYKYTYNYEAFFDYADVDFIMEHEFIAPVSGELTFRLLAPINSGTTTDVFDFRFISELSVELVEDKSNDFLTGVRPIAFTNEKNVDISFISTESEAIKNNFGLNPLLSVPYERSIDFSDDYSDAVGSHVLFVNSVSPEIKELNLKSFKVSDAIYNEIVFEFLKSNIFVRTAAGIERAMKSWYFNANASAEKRMAYLVDYDQGCNLPANYVKESLLTTGDELNYIYFEYPVEDLSNRASWKINGFSDFSLNKSFNEVLARLFHFTRPSIMIALEVDYYDMIFPGDIVNFNYKDEDKKLIPTSLKINLASGKTNANMNELKLEDLTDITFE